MIRFTRQTMTFHGSRDVCGMDRRTSASSDVVGVEQWGPFQPQKKNIPERQAMIPRGSAVYQDLQNTS